MSKFQHVFSRSATSAFIHVARFYLNLFILIIAGSTNAYGFDSNQGQTIRPPAVAGQFYPAEPSKLKQALHYFFQDAVSAAVEKPIAVIAPHAGYIYSGQIAADSYNQARNHRYDLVVLLGTNHTTPGFRGVSIYPRGGYRTPLGLAQIDEQVARALINAGEEYTYHPEVHVREHSVEVQVPFIQYLFPGAKIVPVVIGSPDLDLCTNFGRVLAEVLKDRNALIVASSDLSHYPAQDDAVEVDQQTLEAILKLDPGHLHSVFRKQMNRKIANLVTCACGEAPLLTAIEAAKQLGANCATIVSYANSGQTSIGFLDRVVGYGAVAITRDENCGGRGAVFEHLPKVGFNRLPDSDKRALLAFARKTMKQFLLSETIPLARGFAPILMSERGAFVTLRKAGELRGCVGHIQDDMPLCQVVGAMALQAAFNDRRFPPVTLDELPSIDIEISVLTPGKQIDNVDEIIPGRDGVAMRKGDHQAVFLPQVAAERSWDRYELLVHLCLKAGLPIGSWKKDAELYIFQAEIFDESELK